jgi:hypothetical protein
MLLLPAVLAEGDHPLLHQCIQLVRHADQGQNLLSVAAGR